MMNVWPGMIGNSMYHRRYSLSFIYTRIIQATRSRSETTAESCLLSLVQSSPGHCRLGRKLGFGNKAHAWNSMLWASLQQLKEQIWLGWVIRGH